MRLHFRVERHNAAHVVFAVFVNGAHAGLLTMRTDEARELAEATVPDVVRGPGRVAIDVDPFPEG